MTYIYSFPPPPSLSGHEVTVALEGGGRQLTRGRTTRQGRGVSVST